MTAYQLEGAAAFLASHTPEQPIPLLRGLQLFARFDSASGEGVTNVYDPLGRLVSSSVNLDGVTRTLAYQHDAAGQRTRITHPDGNFFRTLYDTLGRAYYLDANAGPAIAFTYFYPHGAPSILDRPNIAPTYFNYDLVQRVSRIVHTYAGWVGNADWTWTYNPAGQIAAMSRDNDAYAWTGAYAVTRPYTANGLNQYTTAGSANFAYDANGNLVSDGTNSYLYDVENRLVGGPYGTALTYDPLGRLFRYAVGAANATFLYDGDALVAEYGGATLNWRYAHWVGADVPMIAYRRPSGATTPAQRASVQGRPCVHCGRISNPQRAGHKRALVREHYETGSINRARMRSMDAVRPECIKCSAQEGAELSRYSREMRRRLGDHN